MSLIGSTASGLGSVRTAAGADANNGSSSVDAVFALLDWESAMRMFLQEQQGTLRHKLISTDFLTNFDGVTRIDWVSTGGGTVVAAAGDGGRATALVGGGLGAGTANLLPAVNHISGEIWIQSLRQSPWGVASRGQMLLVADEVRSSLQVAMCSMQDRNSSGMWSLGLLGVTLGGSDTNLCIWYQAGGVVKGTPIVTSVVASDVDHVDRDYLMRYDGAHIFGYVGNWRLGQRPELVGINEETGLSDGNAAGPAVWTQAPGADVCGFYMDSLIAVTGLNP